MGAKFPAHPFFLRRAPDRLDERGANGYEMASRQVAGASAKQAARRNLDGIRMAKEK
jgi:hypothetical protein